MFTVAACTKHQTRPAAEVIAADPLGPLYGGTTTLIATYDQAMITVPALVGTAGPLREEHRQHLIALAALIGIAAPAIPAGPGLRPPSTSPSSPAGPGAPTPSGTAGSGDVVAARVALSGAEKSAQIDAVAACLAATGDRIAILASIAACRAAHVAVLR